MKDDKDSLALDKMERHSSSITFMQMNQTATKRTTTTAPIFIYRHPWWSGTGLCTQPRFCLQESGFQRQINEPCTVRDLISGGI
ncbi:unnamed protein product [Toxocara canis]|uniref:Uncharacterized protein n=1 Tax=Toxocara canis TaxID=6265 RepID=A0A183URM2_TOXCA|nr:unnamed protein product [Toxocara canis]